MRFRETFKAKPLMIFSPGKINIIGDSVLIPNKSKFYFFREIFFMFKIFNFVF